MQGKNEIIVELYALRAGMSVISGNADKVRNMQDYEESLERKADDGNGVLAERERDVKKAQEFVKQKDGVRTEKKNIAEDKKQIFESKEYVQCKNGYKAKYKHTETGTYVKMFFIGLAITFPFVLLTSCIGACTLQEDCWILIVAAAVLGIILTIIYMICHHFKEKKNNKKFEYVCSKENFEKAEDEYNKAQEEYEGSVDALRCAELARDEQVKVCEDNHLEAENAKKGNLPVIQGLAEDCKKLENALSEQYEKLIIKEDWQNVDLIIFYLQTGRADNMKEALRLADRQRQTDAIVKEIANANVSICGSIRSGLSSLGSAMGQCFDRLSGQIAKQFEISLNRQNALADSVAGLEKQHSKLLAETVSGNAAREKLVTQTELNSALLEKANLTSDKLREDMLFMQERMGLR